MKASDTTLHGVKVLTPVIFHDERGFFFESYNKKVLQELGIEYAIVQENISYSKKNVIRGLHYQYQFPQGKLISVVDGSILDVVVDLRVTSPSFKKVFTICLTANSYQQLWVPPGFAHGFKVKSQYAILLYKVTQHWFPNDENIILWNDPELSIDWKIDSLPIISPKDRCGLPFNKVPKFD